MIDTGYYDGVLTDWGCNKSETGTGYIFLVFDVEGQERTVRLFTSTKAWPYTKEKIQRLGFDGENFPNELYQQGTRLQCSHEEYQGKTHEKWDLALGGGAKPDDDADLTQQFKKKWQAEHGPPKQKAATTLEKMEAGEQPDEEEVPF